MNSSQKKYSVIVVGAGHAGCEAALASARLGLDTLLLTMNISALALMPCNPSIGGPGKGHLVREIGALGGEMPHCVDETCIQMKWLNVSKGPAVRARRAQADKFLYRQRMTTTLFSTPNLTLRQGQVVEILADNGKVAGVTLETGLKFLCDKLILTTGTYLESNIILGASRWSSGPHNQRPAIGLSDSLRKVGIKLRRLQTATPPRVLRSSVDFSKMRELPGDIDSGGFLWENRERLYEKQISCYLTFTDEKTVQAVKNNMKYSPLVLENITNEGPKHCPSIDRKILRFPDQIVHQIFVEPEGWDSEELYLQGLTTGMPPEAQREILASVPGLENAEILRYGYAIEYDALAPGSIRKTMETRDLKGLYTAGQLNGTSGYEEAAAQGLIAGINAANSILGKKPYWPSRTQSYIGVLVDDLATWDRPEPYRITPGHAEFRLTLRDDSAEARLLNDGYEIGLVNEERYGKIREWVKSIDDEIARLDELSIFPTKEIRALLKEAGTGDLKKRINVSEMLQRPEINYQKVFKFLDGEKPGLLANDQVRCLETEIRYRGYFRREIDRIEQTKFLENFPMPLDLPEKAVKVFSAEVIEILKSDRFDDLNQVVRKNCLTKADLAILLAILKESCV